MANQATVLLSSGPYTTLTQVLSRNMKENAIPIGKKMSVLKKRLIVGKNFKKQPMIDSRADKVSKPSSSLSAMLRNRQPPSRQNAPWMMYTMAKTSIRTCGNVRKESSILRLESP